MCVRVAVGRQTTTNTKRSSTPRPGICEELASEALGTGLLWWSLFATTSLDLLSCYHISCSHPNFNKWRTKGFLWFLMHESEEDCSKTQG